LFNRRIGSVVGVVLVEDDLGEHAHKKTLVVVEYSLGERAHKKILLLLKMTLESVLIKKSCCC
jgi:hypothetical protein